MRCAHSYREGVGRPQGNWEAERHRFREPGSQDTSKLQQSSWKRTSSPRSLAQFTARSLG